MMRILFAVLLITGVLSGYLWLRVDALIMTNDNLTNDVTQYELTTQINNTTIVALQESIVRRSKLLTKQHNNNQTLQIKLRQKQHTLSTMSKKNETVKVWVDELVPDAISRLLCHTQSCGKN